MLEIHGTGLFTRLPRWQKSCNNAQYNGCMKALFSGFTGEVWFLVFEQAWLPDFGWPWWQLLLLWFFLENAKRVSSLVSSHPANSLALAGCGENSVVDY